MPANLGKRGYTDWNCTDATDPANKANKAAVIAFTQINSDWNATDGPAPRFEQACHSSHTTAKTASHKTPSF